MQRNFITKFSIGALCAASILFFVYQLPPVQAHLGWRIDFAMTYLRGIIYPAQNMPTVRPQPSRTGTPPVLQTQTPTPEPILAASPATREPTAASTSTPTPLPGAIRLDPPKYEKQTMNNCGPASLANYLRYYGWEGDQTTIASLIKTKPDDRNVNVEELVYFVRTHAGWLNMEYRVGMTLDDIKRFIAAGIPVVIEETFHSDAPYWPNDDLWAGHYLLITGYDDSVHAFITQDTYYGADRPVDYQELDRNWKAFNRVLLVVYLPDQDETVRSIFGGNWDPDANRQNALQAAQAETQADPKDAFAWFNKGTNLVYFDRYAEAVEAYDAAREIGLPQRMLRYQFGLFLAYFHANRNEDLLALTEYALQRTPNAEEALLWHGWALYRQGNTAGAESEFRKALAANASYQDAKYALQYIGALQ